MTKSVLILKKSLNRYRRLLKSLSASGFANTAAFAQLIKDVSPSLQLGALGATADSSVRAKIAIPQLFGTGRLVHNPDAVHAADVSMYNLLALTGITPRTIVLNGRNEHGAVASATTARVGTFAGTHGMFEAPYGFLDRHGLVKRDVRGLVDLLPSRAIWRTSPDGMPEIDRLERDVFKAETGRSESSIISSEQRDGLPIFPESRQALLDYMRSYSPINFEEFETKLNSGKYSESELTQLIVQATTKHNIEIKNKIYTTPEGQEAIAKHFLLPHLYFYPQGKGDPIPPIFDPKKNSDRLFFDAHKKILVKNESNRYTPYAIYHAFSNVSGTDFKSLLTYFRPNPLLSHYFINKNMPRGETETGFKSSVAHSYSPYSHTLSGQLSLKPEWQAILDTIPVLPNRDPWDQEKAMGLAREMFIKSRRHYSQEVLNSSFGKLGTILGYRNDVNKFAPYDRYIMPSSSDAGAAEGRRSLSILAIANEIMNKRQSTVPWQGMYQFNALPETTTNGNSTWWVNPPDMTVDEKDGISFPQRQQSSFINQRIATGATDLSMNTGLTKVRGWPYQWRSINAQHDLADGDEHALILDIFRALHQHGKNWSDINAHYDLIHKTLVAYRSASGFSSHHRLVNDIADLYQQNFNAQQGNGEAIKNLIDADKPVAPDGKDFFAHFTQTALQKRKAYLDSIAAWKISNALRGPLEKTPLPQVENKLYHELSTLIDDDDVAKKVGKRIDAQSKEHEKYISGRIATSGASSPDKLSEKSHFFRTYIHPFVTNIMKIHGSEPYIPGTSIKIPDKYEDPTWGADDAERKYHQDVVFHFAHHLMKTIVGNEACHWCDGHGIIKTEDMRGSTYCSHCNVGKSSEDEGFRQIHEPEMDEETRRAVIDQRRVVPAWDISQMGTYANNSGASQLTPRLLENFNRLYTLHAKAIKDLIGHDVTKTLIDHFINNPEKYVPLTSRTGDEEDSRVDAHPGNPPAEEPIPSPVSVPPAAGLPTAVTGVRRAARRGVADPVAEAGASAPPSGPAIPPVPSVDAAKRDFGHYID